jgi:23S rRNA (cytidine1920-2'-O)/16S rRNA (cytidine1409-2'-O)-methyltransferase
LIRRRLDQELIRRGLLATTEEARKAIDAGRVTVGGRSTVKAETLVSPSEPVAVQRSDEGFASRAGFKLAGALDRFEVDPAGRSCLDAGASSGGFTDVLLSRGAARVIAVDVGYGQLAWNLRTDDRVTVLERTNIRDMEPSLLPFRPDLVTADLSFISLAKVVPDLVSLAGEDADLILLVKPQFEAPRGDVGAGGVVDDPAVWSAALESVAGACQAAGAGVLDAAPSELPGPAGNVEFFLLSRRGAAPGKVDLKRVAREGEKLRPVRGEAS